MTGNLAQLMRLARLPYPLPLGGLTARRSLLSLDNLATAVAHVLTTPERLRRPLIVADPQPLTLSQMLTAMRRGLGRRPALVPVPAALLRMALEAAGHADSWQFVTGSLVADPAALIGLGWAPKVATDDGLEQLMRSTPKIA